MCALREYSKKCLAKWISKQTCITIHLAETWERPLSGLFIWACIEQSFFLKPKSLHKSTLFHGIIERTLPPILSVYTLELFLQVIRWQEQSIWWILMIPIGFVGKNYHSELFADIPTILTVCRTVRTRQDEHFFLE